MKRLLQGVIISGLFMVLGLLISLPAPASAQNDFNTAIWTGVFYNNTNFSGTSALASYPTGLLQNWGTLAPVDGFGAAIPGISNDNFSARFSTTLTLTPGLYEFQITADDAFKLTIGPSVIMDELASGDGPITRSEVVQVDATITVVVEYVETTGNALILVSWQASDGTPAPTSTPVPLATAEVITVRGLALRTGPFLGASLINVLRPNNTYDLRAVNTQEGIFNWYQVAVDEDTIGWASGRYLQLSGTPELLPLENSTIFDTVNITPNFDVIGTTRSVMNFRQRPSPRVTRIPEIPQIPWGAQVEILARTVQGGRDFWYQVEYCRPDGFCAIGWILASFVEVDRGIAPIDAIPIF